MVFLAPVFSAVGGFLARTGISRVIAHVGTTALGFIGGGGVSGIGKIVKWGAIASIAYYAWEYFNKKG